ncbi:hypothetical protein B0H67DRAFT_642327 [Lasiosphaeris hirsuta]|uniref:DUF6594 domain-containing protein n=1 Tax=Lasiosphaeris hirsuta TaxID=260670 RepID=A0AA40B1J5_9PEZI|nr:hypothetical protein B0H67DRAFT_642327 [Lasiosphaeris hirsuta]
MLQLRDRKLKAPLTRRVVSALRDYRTFRTEGESLFATKKLLSEVIKEIRALDDARSKLAHLPADSEEAQSLGEQIDQITKTTGEALLQAMNQATSDMVRQKVAKAKKALWSRLVTALGAGLALVIPMLIMVLHPTNLAKLATTTCFVVLVAAGLAMVMEDSQPKEAVAYTAAYAAVLVLFIGAGGGG